MCQGATGAQNAMLDGLAALLRAQPLHEPLTRPLLLLQVDEKLGQVRSIVTSVQVGRSQQRRTSAGDVRMPSSVAIAGARPVDPLPRASL
jgi:hypothetical protein